MQKENLNIFAAVCVLMMALTGSAAGKTIYVDPNGSADFTGIQAAINASSNDDEIEVAPGTYNEAINFNGKAVRLYSSGGRDVTTIDGNGHYHVVQCVNSEGPNTILEGFTITGGDANGPDDSDQRGGGMYNYYSSPTVTNCIFIYNTAVTKGGGISNYYSDPKVSNCVFGDNSASSKGGGMYNEYSSPTVTNCTFSGNNADSSGGGMHTDWMNPTVSDCTFIGNLATYGGGMNNNVSSPIITNCTFSNNPAEYGGGMYNNNDVGIPKVTDCIFTSNSAYNEGGGMYNNNCSPTVTNCTFSENRANHCGGMQNINSSPTVTNCTFSHNSALVGIGGGMYNLNYSSPIVTNCTFTGNQAATNGGGMDNRVNSNPEVTKCNFSENEATMEGGGMYNYQSSPTVTNCKFTGNSTGEDGGGMFNNDGAPTVINCVFYDNYAADVGGAMVNSHSNTKIRNCTFSDNSAARAAGGIRNYYSYPFLTNCILWGDEPGPELYDGPGSAIVSYCDIEGWTSGGSGNINADPCFVDAAGGDLRLSPGSPCIDVGVNVLNLPATDIAGNPRIWDGDGNGNWVVDMGAYEFGAILRVRNMRSGQMYANIQLAIDDANDYDEIEVSPGPYNEAIIFKGKALRLYSSDGPEVTTIDATGLSSSVVRCINGEDANTVLDGFTITGGTGSHDPLGHICGGGMRNENSSPTVTNCTFSNNSAGHHGGGMSNFNSSPAVTNCTFTNNSSVHWGGGMYNDMESHSTVTNCTFSGNLSDTGGGGMSNYNSNPTVTNCTFSDNNSPYGGGMYNTNTSNPNVTNCTLSGNSADDGGGIYNDGGNPTLTNCILWGNIGGEIVDNFSTTTVTYSDVQGGWGDSNDPNNTNIDADPCFIDAAGGDLRLMPDSPCINTGYNSAPSLPATDIAGNPRILGGTVDMGAFELLIVHNITKDLSYEAIQSAIDDANDYDEIVVAPGTYNEAINFLGKPIRLYSSGGRDVTTIDANGLNSSVVTCNSGEEPNTILEGFTITGGNATYGGGMYCSASSPTVINCTFSENQAARGGGMYNDNGSNPTVTNCKFSGNEAERGGGTYNRSNSSPTVSNCIFSNNSASDGGGMYNEYSSPIVTDCTFSGNTSLATPHFGGGGMFNNYSSPTVTNCTFSENTTTGEVSHGGGMCNKSSSPTLTNCTFTNNSSVHWGGGMYNDNGSHSTVTNCTFSSNISYAGGGGIGNYSSSPTVTNCTFTGNSTGDYGGGMYNTSNSSPTVINCIFSENQAARGGGMYNNNCNPTVINCTFSENTTTGEYSHGGGMCNHGSSPTLTNCTFTNNSSVHWGGGMYNDDGSHSTVTNCTFIGNISDAGGGGIGNFSSNPTVTNCILWGNIGSEIFDGGTSITTITYSDIKGGWGGTGNIDSDPCFVDVINPDPNLWNLRLKPDSPCIDVGNNSEPNLPLNDMDGHPRIIDGDCDEIKVVDMGAYEFNYAYMGDLDYNCSVNFFDYSILAGTWQTKAGDPGWDWACDISGPPDDYIDWRDVAILCGNWVADTGSEL